MTDAGPQGQPAGADAPAPKIRHRTIAIAGIVLFCVAAIAVVGVCAGLRERKPDPNPANKVDPQACTVRPFNAKMNRAGLQEWRWAHADHEIIATAVAACSNVLDLRARPGSVREQLRLDTGPYGEARCKPATASDQVDKSPAKTATASDSAAQLNLSNFQRAAIYLSDAIARARFENALNASANFRDMYWFQLFIVLIGAVTTILISIKSITDEDQSKRYLPGGFFFTIGILAIVTSATGTAASGLNAFYGPRENYLKSERNLAALRQLHGEIAVAVASTRKSDKCGEFRMSDAGGQDDSAGSSASNSQYAKWVQDWTARFGAIVNTSESSSASPDDAAADDSP